jgi:hypothetical protein
MSATRKASGQNLGGLAQSHSAMGHLTPRESDSQCPDCAHQILDFADDRASARTQVMLHTEPERKSGPISARESASMLGCSASIFLAMSSFSLFLLRVIMSTASGGKIGNSSSGFTRPNCLPVFAWRNTLIAC